MSEPIKMSHTSLNEHGVKKYKIIMHVCLECLLLVINCVHLAGIVATHMCLLRDESLIARVMITGHISQGVGGCLPMSLIFRLISDYLIPWNEMHFVIYIHVF